ncbi:MAG TPA: VOC family protein [Solirubrobacteraceae bacterium]|nr:VOC family protein [Solirubrobacteraceae bacterium]
MSAIGGMHGVEHVGVTVPDIEEAKTFFVEALGCEAYYELGPFADPDGTWMSDNLDVHPRAEIPKMAMLRCANGASFELFEYKAPDQVQRVPKMADWGGTHIAFYVDDIDAALAHVEAHGARVLNGRKDCMGPEAGEEAYFAHFLSPWGQVFEFVSYPNGREYMKDGTRPLYKPAPVS